MSLLIVRVGINCVELSYGNRAVRASIESSRHRCSGVRGFCLSFEGLSNDQTVATYQNGEAKTASRLTRDLHTFYQVTQIISGGLCELSTFLLITHDRGK